MVTRLRENSSDILERILYSFRILLSRTSTIRGLVEIVLDLSQTIHTRMDRSLAGLADVVPVEVTVPTLSSSSPLLSPIDEGDEDSASRLLPSRIRSGPAEPSDPVKKMSRLQSFKKLFTRKSPPRAEPLLDAGGTKQPRRYNIKKIKKIKTKISRMSRREQTQKRKKYTRRRKN